MFMTVVGKGDYSDDDESDGGNGGGYSGYSGYGGYGGGSTRDNSSPWCLVATRESEIKFCLLDINPRDLNYNK